jgi:hypothetical protein
MMRKGAAGIHFPHLPIDGIRLEAPDEARPDDTCRSRDPVSASAEGHAIVGLMDLGDSDAPKGAAFKLNRTEAKRGPTLLHRAYASLKAEFQNELHDARVVAC